MVSIQDSFHFLCELFLLISDTLANCIFEPLKQETGERNGGITDRNKKTLGCTEEEPEKKDRNVQKKDVTWLKGVDRERCI